MLSRFEPHAPRKLLLNKKQIDERMPKTAGESEGRGSESGLFGLHEARGNRRPMRVGFRLDGCSVREAASLPRLSLLGLKGSQAQQGEPMRMALAGHQFPRALALALGTPAA